MPLRLTRLAVSVGLAAIALAAAPLLTSDRPLSDGHSQASASPSYGDENVRQGTPAVAWVDQRDAAPERSAKHRLVLVAILTALVATPVLVRAANPRVEQRGWVRRAAASPFSGRAPPRLALCCD